MTKKIQTKGAAMADLEHLQKNLKAKETILKRLAAIDAELQAAYPDRLAKRSECENIRDELEKWKAKFTNYGRIDEGNLGKDDKETLAECRNRLILLEEAQTEAEALSEKLENEKNALQAELASFRSDMTAPDVLAYQEKVAEARNKADEIRAILKSQELVLAEASTAPVIIGELREKREDILAEMAAGKDLKKELDEVTQAIDTETQNIAVRERTLTDTRQAISGLNRKLTEADKALKELEDQKGEVLCQYLRQEAEHFGKIYGKLALSLVEKYHVLVALDAFITQYGGKTIRGKEFQEFTIPAFRLNAHKGLTSKKWPDEIANAFFAFTQDNKIAAIERERYRITGLGIKL